MRAIVIATVPALALAAAIMLLSGIGVLWVINTLFPLSIAYTPKTIVAATLLIGLLRPDIFTKRKD
jgi:hypothetical protein